MDAKRSIYIILVRKFYKTFLLILAGISGIVLINRYLFVDFLTNGVYGLFNKPGLFLTQKFGETANFLDEFLSSGFKISKIIAENNNLKTQNLELISEIAKIKQTEEENTSLKAQLGLPPKNQHQLLSVKVFSLNQSNLTSTILINRGSADGIKKSMAVIAAGNVLVGVVQEVYNDYSLAFLLDDPRSIVSVKIGGNNIIANVRGVKSYGKVFLDLITNSELVNKDDLIVTSGLDNLGESLLVGRIDNVNLQGGNLFKGVTGKLLYYPLTNPNLFILLK